MPEDEFGRFVAEASEIVEEIVEEVFEDILDEFRSTRNLTEDEQEQVAFVPTASEALYSFMGWLTSRDQPLMVGARIDCVPVVGLVKEFCRVNKIPDPRDDVKWGTLLKHPEAPLKR